MKNTKRSGGMLIVYTKYSSVSLKRARARARVRMCVCVCVCGVWCVCVVYYPSGTFPLGKIQASCDTVALPSLN